jgi:hypothetical protein
VGVAVRRGAGARGKPSRNLALSLNYNLSRPTSPRLTKWSVVKMQPTEVEQQLVASLPLVDRLAISACRGSRMTPADVEDFVGEVKLVEDDYAALRKFEGRCSLPTYGLQARSSAQKSWRALNGATSWPR